MWVDWILEAARLMTNTLQSHFDFLQQVKEIEKVGLSMEN
jgi:hypothetical protein